MIRTPFVLLFPGLFLVQVAAQTDTFETKFLRLIADRVDTATATRTAKLAQVGLPIREAYSLAYQGINPEAMASLRKSGLDLQAALNNWPPQLNDGVVLADCIVIGKVESIKYVADALYNKYYYVRVEQWIKGMPTKNNLVIVRTKGGGSSPIPGVSITVSHEVVFEKGEKLLLLLSRSAYELDVPFEVERPRDEYPYMYVHWWSNKLVIHGDQIVEYVDEGSHRTVRTEEVLKEARAIRAKMEAVADKLERKKGAQNND